MGETWLELKQNVYFNTDIQGTTKLPFIPVLTGFIAEVPVALFSLEMLHNKHNIQFLKTMWSIVAIVTNSGQSTIP